jgi:N-carbamoylputrescine amidase
MKMKIAFVQWSDGLLPYSAAWQDIVQHIHAAAPDLLVTNEMPFGTWLPVSSTYDALAANQWCDTHIQALACLRNLPCTVISSRPVIAGDYLTNEAFALESGKYIMLHHKHYFPAEDGWQEAAWFVPQLHGFTVHHVAGLRVGVLLCTELMFNEHARAYGRAGADLIVTPRASGQTMHTWHVAAAMAALAGGTYVLSSNRVGRAANSPHTNPQFGGEGFAYAPGGKLMATTTANNPLSVIELDPACARAAQGEYPCYVKEL